MKGISKQRAYTWCRRLVWMLAGVFTIFAVALYFDLPSAWIAPVFSFVCAEVTRRICAESNPDVSLRWRDMMRLLLRPDSAFQVPESEDADLTKQSSRKVKNGDAESS